MKKSFQNYLTIGFSLFIMVFFSCTPQKNSTVHINANLKSYFNYQPGSYWVFYDALNNYYDSLTVETYSDGQNTANNIQIESCDIGIFEYHLDSINVSAIWGLTLTQNNTLLTIGETIYSEFTQNFPFITGTSSFGNSNPYPEAVNTTFLSSFGVGNNNYTNVYEIIYTYSNTSYSDTFYINQDQGFLEIILNNQYFQKKLYLNRYKIIN